MLTLHHHTIAFIIKLELLIEALKDSVVNALQPIVIEE